MSHPSLLIGGRSVFRSPLVSSTFALMTSKMKPLPSLVRSFIMWNRIYSIHNNDYMDYSLPILRSFLKRRAVFHIIVM
jgi:hypothetical protein